MKRIFGTLIDIRKGEVGITLLMLANYYLILTTYYFLKPARDSLFLVRVDPDQLPIVFIIIAIVIAPITSVYSRAARHMKLNNLINLTSGIIIVNLLILRWLITLDEPWVYYLFYTWVSIYGVLTTSQFWLLANAVYDAAQAKRLFVLLGLAGIVGAITGGSVTSLVVNNFGIGTENLLFFCMGLLAITMVLVVAIWRMRDPEAGETAAELRGAAPAEDKESFLESFALIRKSRYLLLIVGMIGLTVFVASFADYQFKTIAKHSFDSADALTSFFGQFYSGLSLVSLVLQAVFAHRFLRVLGVGGVILFLPISLLLATGALIVVPAAMMLYAAVALRGADGGLRYSLDKTGRELLFLPVPYSVKKKTKVFIDMFVDRWSRGMAGGLLILTGLVFSALQVEAWQVQMRWVSVIVLVFVAAWIVLAVLMRREYVNTFRQALDRREIDLSELRQDISESSTIKTLLASLKSDNERQVSYALSMLRSAPSVDLREEVRPLLHHGSADVRREAAMLLRDNPGDELVDKMKDLLEDDDPGVRREAVRYLLEHTEGAPERKKRVYLDHPDHQVRAAALECVALYGSPAEHRMIDDDFIASILSDKSEHAEDGRVQLANALAHLNLPDRRKYIKRLLHDPHPAVVREAALTAGRIKDREFVPWLLEKLGDRNYRAAAVKALALFGERIHGTLRDYLIDESVPMMIRRTVPRILGRIPHQNSVNILTTSIPDLEPSLKYFAVKALNSLRTKHPELKFSEERVDRVLIEETRAYYELLQVFLHHKKTPEDMERLLCRALYEKLDLNLERIFRLLGLRYPPRDIYSAYLGLVSDRRALRASAVEFLDNVLHGDLKKYLFPIIDEASGTDVARRGQALFGVRFENREQAMLYLIEGRDSWLRACALYQAGCEQIEGLREKMEAARSDHDPTVRETASLALRLLDNNAGTRSGEDSRK